MFNFASSYADGSLAKENRWVGDRIYKKGVYYALVLIPWNPEKISKKSIQNKSNVNAPWVLYVNTHYASLPLAYSYAYGNIRHSLGVYTYRRGALTLFVSIDRAILRSPKVWSEQQYRASRFFFYFQNTTKFLQISGLLKS